MDLLLLLPASQWEDLLSSIGLGVLSLAAHAERLVCAWSFAQQGALLCVPVRIEDDAAIECIPSDLLAGQLIRWCNTPTHGHACAAITLL